MYGILHYLGKSPKSQQMAVEDMKRASYIQLGSLLVGPFFHDHKTQDNGY